MYKREGKKGSQRVLCGILLRSFVVVSFLFFAKQRERERVVTAAGLWSRKLYLSRKKGGRSTESVWLQTFYRGGWGRMRR